jgi:hypothetical protein
MNDLDTSLRHLDPADAPSSVLSERARADLDRIVATDPTPSPYAAPARRRTRTWVAIGLAAAAALAVAGVMAPGMLRSGDTAFASWTPVAAGLTGTQAAEAGESCRDQLTDSSDRRDLDRTRVSVADRRGDWTTVLLTGDDGFSGLCVTDASAGWFARDMIGSSGTMTDWSPLGPRALAATDMGTGTMKAGDISLVAGFAGDEVTGVVLPNESHGDVTATVADGRFALWFPGDELADDHTASLEVTYADGTTEMVELSL